MILAPASSRLIAAILVLCIGFPAAANADIDYHARVLRVLKKTPLIDGHNDLPWEIHDRFKSRMSAVDLSMDTSHLPVAADASPLMTDIPRLRAGQVGGQFWSVWIPVEIKGYEAVQLTLEQIDLVKRMTERNPSVFEMAYTAADVRRIHGRGKIASLVGIEGGHQINNSLAVLRQMYDLGARYMTLTHVSNTDWADAATDVPVHQGLTAYGQEVIREMNRMGMLVDLSHVSPQTMRAALAVTEAPVIFSHSSARAIVDHPRDVPDDILAAVARNGGVVMVNFCPCYVSAERNQWEADRSAEQARFSSPPYGGMYIGQPQRAAAALAAWDKAHPQPVVTLQQVADHIEHVRRAAGVDNVGLGSDFDGIPDAPVGLEAVDRYPALLEELMRRGWSDADISKLAGENVLRVMATAEQVSARLRKSRPASEATLAAPVTAPVATPVSAPVTAPVATPVAAPVTASVPATGRSLAIGDLPIKAKVHLGKTADWVAVAPDAIWVGSTGPYAVHKLDPQSGSRIASVALRGEPCAGLATGFGSLWIPLCAPHAGLAKVDLRSNTLVATFDVSPAAAEGGIATSADSVWMVVDKKGTLARIDPATGVVREKTHIPPGSYNPHYKDGVIWITRVAGDAVTLVDAATGVVSATVHTGPGPRFLTSGADAVWTLNQGDGSLTRIDAAQHATQTALGTPGPGGDISYGAGMIWTTMMKTPLAAIDAATGQLRCRWVGAGGDSLGIDHEAIWLTDYHAGNVVKMDLQDVLRQCPAE